MRRLLVTAMAAALVAAVPAPAAALEGVTTSDHVIVSFDGTPIEATLLVPPGVDADAPAPLVLRTHGWGGSRETAPGGGADIDPGSGTLGRLLDEGYVVLTWDSRGFGCSGGTVRIDDPDVEGRDVSALLDWAVANAPIVLDGDGDPVVGMTGGSYAGGIQLAAAAVDDRLDALAPEIAWSDLGYSLNSGDVVNQGWVAFLYSLGTATGTTLGLSPACASGPHVGGGLDPAIDRGVVEFVTAGRPQQGTLDFFAKSSLASFGTDRPVQVPTLVMQGSVDTLFDLTDGYGIYEHVADQGVEARFVAFCGGHVACPASYVDAGDRRHLDDAIVTWFDRHLRGADVDPGPPVEYRTNAGVWTGADAFPATDTGWVELAGRGDGLVALPVLDVPDVAGALTGLQGTGGVPALPITTSSPSPQGDPRAATIPVARADGDDLEVVGIPEITVEVAATTVPLDTALAPLADGVEELGLLRTVDDVLVGQLGPLEGIAGGVTEASGLAGLADARVHLHVKLVHREAGEVLNLQEGSVAVAADGSTTAEVPMPGVAYTLPAGDHLDVQVATHSLMHSSGRVPALVDVAVSGRVPASGPAAPATAPSTGAPEDEPERDGQPEEVADGTDVDELADGATPASAPLPVTGGSLVGGLALLAAAGVVRRRR